MTMVMVILMKMAVIINEEKKNAHILCFYLPPNTEYNSDVQLTLTRVSLIDQATVKK